MQKWVGVNRQIVARVELKAIELQKCRQITYNLLIRGHVTLALHLLKLFRLNIMQSVIPRYNKKWELMGCQMIALIRNLKIVLRPIIIILPININFYYVFFDSISFFFCSFCILKIIGYCIYILYFLFYI